ncbi:MAG: hypothetical protein LBF16_02720 [Pseudomonadales bacterium]|jgi:predicted methyltransferase|nr:hypothetical protein [Pseudomonadales bacterium]
MRKFTKRFLKQESDLLRNPQDDLNAQIFTNTVYRTTDRFVLLFGK